MASVFVLRGSDIYEVLDIERVPGEPLPGGAPRCSLLGALQQVANEVEQEVRAALAQPPAPTAQQCTCPSGDGSLRWPCPQHPANIAQPVQQPGAEPDMRHPKIQALIGSKARCQIELMLVEQLIEDPDCDLTSMDMEYWGPMHDRLKEALTKAAPAQRQPLSDDTKTQMWRAAYRDDPRRLGSFEWYAQGVEDAEAAHKITAAPAAQKGEKL